VHGAGVSIIVFASLVCAFAVSGTFKPLAILASGSILGVCLATIRLRFLRGALGRNEPGGVLDVFPG